ncbi:MAG: hypothetical protein KC589_09715 [Nanoarchaeota archaeon]|nr:hypothetical protein [Nanoarchaeota archaeon]
MTEETKNVTLKLNSGIYDKYREFCKEKGLLASRQVEIFMENQMKEGSKNEN